MKEERLDNINLNEFNKKYNDNLFDNIIKLHIYNTK